MGQGRARPCPPSMNASADRAPAPGAGRFCWRKLAGEDIDKMLAESRRGVGLRAPAGCCARGFRRRRSWQGKSRGTGEGTR